MIDYQHVHRVDLADGLGNDVDGEDCHVDAGREADCLLHLLEHVEGSSEDGDTLALQPNLVGQGEADAAGSAGDDTWRFWIGILIGSDWDRTG
ncbi:hypothetical protein CMV_019029 [Castanea mollissima]|uniref:Uncharacterized protein n=1 Tax=Castanea mollissima TaxID=60419 RepID=A0A8J4VN57_9ROSI|nr:hypothetical protein CMV_019029 [Castanea mollissima]